MVIDMKIMKFIVILMICILTLAIIATELYIRYTEYTLKKDLEVAIKDYAIEYCNKEVEVNGIYLSYSWNTATWIAQSQPEIEYLLGSIDEGIVQLNSAPCTEHEGFILHREKQKFIKFHNLLDPPNFGEANSFNTYRHPGHFFVYAGLVGVCLY
jgi:hypothetical protein